MKIAITARGPELDASIDGGFGRAYWFLIFDDTTGQWDMIDNCDIRNAIDNAGVKAARVLSNAGVDILLTGETGPKAFRTLQAEGMTVFHGANGTVIETLHAWREGKLTEAFCARSKGSLSCLVAPAVVETETLFRDGFRCLVEEFHENNRTRSIS